MIRHLCELVPNQEVDRLRSSFHFRDPRVCESGDGDGTRRHPRRKNLVLLCICIGEVIFVGLKQSIGYRSLVLSEERMEVLLDVRDARVMSAPCPWWHFLLLLTFDSRSRDPTEW